MRPFWKKMLSCAMAFVCLTGAAAGLTGCHGSKERAAFEVPESFDTTKQYEITFWAKNDTNIRKTFPASRLRRFSGAKRKRWRNFVRKARPRQRQT